MTPAQIRAALAARLDEIKADMARTKDLAAWQVKCGAYKELERFGKEIKGK